MGFATRRIGTVCLLLTVIVPISASGGRYYVDSAGGNDRNDGRHETRAWGSLEKVNATVFAPGDTILLKAGGLWTGQLHPKGSGSDGRPIVVDLYGTGNKPVISGNGMEKPVVYLYNQAYWEINHLEITNDAAAMGDRVGVRVAAENAGLLNHIHLRNLNVHHIKGLVDENSMEAKRCGGIHFRVLNDNQVDTRFNDVLIEGCTIASCDGSGISNESYTSDSPGTARWHRRKYTRYVIRGNAIYDISKNAMIVRMADSTCVVERNVCWDTASRAVSGNTIFSRSCLGTVFQFNEGYLNKASERDGSLYDADLSSPRCVFQYSYSHDNNHGLFWNCTESGDQGIVVRYNISRNDKGNIFTINYPAASIHIYNNTVYIPEHLSPVILSERNKGGAGTRTYFFNNNIIYNMSRSARYEWTQGGYNRTIDNNCYFGIHPATEPADPHKITQDPMVDDPGSGGKGLESVSGYKLKKDSPCIDKGLNISGNGGRDYWGNPLRDGKPDIGAHEYSASSTGAGQDPRKNDWSAKQDCPFKNYPNPFNPETRISFDVARQNPVKIDVLDVRGNPVKMLLERTLASGAHSVHWNGMNDTGAFAPAGVYFARVRSGDQTRTIKMALVR